MSDKYLIDELEEKIIDTVGSYMRKNKLTNTPILLSGGYDSGLLTALTGSKRGYRIKFPYGSLWDESRYAYAIAEYLKVNLLDIEVTSENFKENFEKAVKVMGEPTTHFSLVPLYILFSQLKDEGVTDVLSGEGPDEYLGGYARQIIFDELRKLYEVPELRNYHKLIDKALGGDKQALLVRYVQMMGYDLKKVGEYLQYNSDNFHYPLQGFIGKIDMEFGVIEKMEQKMAEHFGVKIHYPYISPEFAEYCYSLPDDLKIRNGVTKYSFKKIADKYLPAIMRGRMKIGGPTAPVNLLMGWDLDPFDKTRYLEEQKKTLGL